MDDSSEGLQAKLHQLAQQLANQSPTVDEARLIKAAMEDILARLDALRSSLQL